MSSAANTGHFEKTSLDWQFQQVQQRIGEWWERLFSRASQSPNPSNWELPDWLLKGLFWLIVLGLTSWALWQLYRLLAPYLLAYWQTVRSDAGLRSTPHPSVSAADWLQRARAAQQQGDFREACRALYLASLQHLDDRHLIDLQPGRTDGEYLSLLNTVDRPQPYRVLIGTHERLCFSQAAISAQTFDRCWQAYQEISQS